MATEIRITETFNAGGQMGNIVVHIPELGSVPYVNIRSAMDNIMQNISRLVVSDPEPAVPWRATHLDPSEITAKIPGIDLTDRRRGPRKSRRK